MYEREILARPSNHSWHGKAIYITYSKYVIVFLGIQHAICMCHIILSSMACRAWPYFSILRHKRQDDLFSFAVGLFSLRVFYILNCVLDITSKNGELGITNLTKAAVHTTPDKPVLPSSPSRRLRSVEVRPTLFANPFQVQLVFLFIPVHRCPDFSRRACRII